MAFGNAGRPGEALLILKWGRDESWRWSFGERLQALLFERRSGASSTGFLPAPPRPIGMEWDASGLLLCNCSRPTLTSSVKTAFYRADGQNNQRGGTGK